MHLALLVLVTAALPDQPRLTHGEQAIEAHLQPHLKACDSGHQGSCRHLSNQLGFLTNEREGALIAASLEKGCSAKVMDACAGLAVAYHHKFVASPVGADPTVLLANACKAKSAFACGQVAELTLREAKTDTAKVKRAQALARSTCARVGGYACYLMAQVLSNAPDTPLKAVAYAQGYLALNSDQEKATALYRQACDQNMGPACFNLAWQFLRGSGAPHDEAKGNLFLEKACVLGDASGCDELDRRKPDHARLCCMQRSIVITGIGAS